MYAGGGNDRHFSEAIADAVYAHYLADGDRAFAVKHLDVMQHVFHLWDDHYDFSNGLYFIEPLLDATEYSIASIDATGGKDGFLGCDAFRPTINSYMYADALAIGKLSRLAGDKKTADAFAANAAAIKASILASLWNDGMQHFIDRYKVDNEYAHYWTNQGSNSSEDWFCIDFGHAQPFHAVALYFYADGHRFRAPQRYTLQSWSGQSWVNLPDEENQPAVPQGNGENRVTFRPCSTTKLRVLFDNHPDSSVALVQIKAY